MKRCHKCNTEKDLLEFHKNRARKDGVDVYCKICSREVKSPPVMCPYCGVVWKRPLGRQVYCSIWCRFWAKVDTSPGFGPWGNCWRWTGNVYGKNRNYGTLWNGTRLIGAHRYSYELHVTSIPEGQEIRHKCDNPTCVNPAHLEVGTHLDNLDDMNKRGRRTRGEQVKASSLTEENIREIRNSYIPYSRKFGEKSLSVKFGVSRCTIYHIVSRKSWSHV